MGRYFLKFSYVGTQYRGLQKNIVSINYEIHDPDTIQGAVESALSTLVPKCKYWPKLTLASRTDVGVHALSSTAHVDLHNKYGCLYNPAEVVKTANFYFGRCNHDIRLLDCTPVTEDFHVRHNVTSRTYLYRIIVPKDFNDQRVPILEKFRAHLVRSEGFDIEKVKRATELFSGTQDYTTFSNEPHTDKPIKYVRRLHLLKVEKGQPLMPLDPLSDRFEYWNIVCTARSFLYRQVRRIVGTLLGVGAGKLTEKDVNIMLQVPSRQSWPNCITVAPAYGLYLVNIKYCPEKMAKYIIKTKESPEFHRIAVPIDEYETPETLESTNLTL